MRARDYWDEAGKLRAEGLATGDIVRRWVRERGMHPRVAARLAHGLTQQQVADRWNEGFPDAQRPCTAKQVSNWETAREPSREALNRLARIYHCAAGDLVEGEDWSHLDGHPVGRARCRCQSRSRLWSDPMRCCWCMPAAVAGSSRQGW